MGWKNMSLRSPFEIKGLNGDPEGRIFLFHPHTNDILFSI